MFKSKALKNNTWYSCFVNAIALYLLWFQVSIPTQAAVPNCKSAAPYTPFYEPLRAPVQPASDISIILVHGKNSTPTSDHFDTTTTALVALGYSVIRPILPWSSKWRDGVRYFEWDGTQCQGLNYLRELVDAEHERGMRVVMMGHSMGGMHTFIYASKEGHGLEAMVAIAPGHMLPFSKTILTKTAEEVERARAEVVAGRGDEVGTYSTYYGQYWPLQTTPNIFLSYHDPLITPDFNDVLPVVMPPWYLLIGTEDPIYGFYERAGIIDKLPAGVPNEYKITSGDHRTVFEHVPALFDTWIKNWSNIGDPPVPVGTHLILQLLNQLLLESP